MTKRVLGDEARGQDDDGDAPAANEQKVQIENAYFERLRERMDRQRGGDLAPGEPATAGPEKPAGHADARDSAPVIYNDDGSIYQKPG